MTTVFWRSARRYGKEEETKTRMEGASCYSHPTLQVRARVERRGTKDPRKVEYYQGNITHTLSSDVLFRFLPQRPALMKLSLIVLEPMRPSEMK